MSDYLYACWWERHIYYLSSGVRRKLPGGSWQDVGPVFQNDAGEHLVIDLIEVDDVPYVLLADGTLPGVRLLRWTGGAWVTVTEWVVSDYLHADSPSCFAWIDGAVRIVGRRLFQGVAVWDVDFGTGETSLLFEPPDDLSTVDNDGSGATPGLSVNRPRRTCAFNNPFDGTELVFGDQLDDAFCWVTRDGLYHDRRDWGGSCVFSMGFDGAYLWGGDFGEYYYASPDGHQWFRFNVDVGGGHAMHDIGEVWEFFEWNGRLFAATCAYDPNRFGMSAGDHLNARRYARILRRTAVDPAAVSDAEDAAAACWEVVWERLIGEAPGDDYGYFADAGIGLVSVQTRPTEGRIYYGFGGEPYYEQVDPRVAVDDDDAPIYEPATVLWASDVPGVLNDIGEGLDWHAGVYLLADASRPTPRFPGGTPKLRWGQRDDDAGRSRQARSVQASARFGPNSYL